MNKVNSDGLCGTVYQAWWSIDAWLRLADADGDVSGTSYIPFVKQNIFDVNTVY